MKRSKTNLQIEEELSENINKED